MDFAQQQRNPARHVLAIVVVLLLHLGIVYALVMARAHKVIEVVQQPVEVAIVTEVRSSPPRPLVLPPPQSAVPPPSYVPSPEIAVVQSPPETNTITAVAPVKPAAVEPLPRRGVRPLDLDACRPQYPRRALREGQTGRGEALLAVASDGRVQSVVITSASPTGVFDKEVVRAMSGPECRFEASNRPYQVIWPWSFTLREE